MASYPSSIATLSTLSAGTSIAASHMNEANDEIEAIATELGTNPRSIDDSAVDSTPDSVANYLGSLGRIVRTLTGSDHWYQAAVPARNMLMFHGGGNTVAVQNYTYVGWGALNATEGQVRWVAPFACRIMTRRCYFQTLSTGGDQALEVAITTPIETYLMFIPASSPAGVYRKMGFDGNSKEYVSLSAGDFFAVRIYDASSAGNSAQIGAVGICIEQVG